MRTPLPSVFFIIILVFVVVVLFISLSYDKVEYLSPNIFDRQQVKLMSVSAEETRKEKCDLFSGRWVYDYSTQPLYSGVGCSYMNDEVACEKFGRKDLKHQRWRWQPHGCSVPRFDPKKLLNRLTGKRIVFVGDSLNRNQWVSMVCMLESAVSSDDSHSMSQNGMVQLAGVAPQPQHSALLRQPVTNTCMVRIHPCVINDHFLFPRSSMMKSVDIRLFCRGYEWGAEGNQNCYNQTQPIEEEGYTGKGSDYKMMRLVEETVERLSHKGVDVQILNITQLSEYRKDGHPSIYRKFWDDLSKERVANPSQYSDCTHWCLPGVPDVWNELLYAFIVSQEQV
ncbi:hypothetical protein B296_00052365 [Ensete ventricosum]|uniref:Uncharacterized protein n=1 Tax=Ensete ventricosum TaxID=4639 RepID=A0A426XE09_ENSVE|nr:hypothetical protein B296_00052365 [Ensete ventricosum]